MWFHGSVDLVVHYVPVALRSRWGGSYTGVRRVDRTTRVSHPSQAVAGQICGQRI